MWKESYKIGVDIVDEQHKELFKATEKLLLELRNNKTTHQEECIAAIVFLKNYAVKHFADEEAYQISVGYKNYQAHKKLHEDFVKNVLFHENKMTASKFALKDIKEFVGMLVTWLTHHVAGIDQSITKEKTLTKKTLVTYADKFQYSTRDVLHKIAGLDMESINMSEKNNADFTESIAVKIEFTGDVKGYVTYVYTKEFARNVIFAMMRFLPETIDELVHSALFEISNIISGTVCRQFGDIACDIKTPVLSVRETGKPTDRLVLDAGIGTIEIETNLS